MSVERPHRVMQKSEMVTERAGKRGAGEVELVTGWSEECSGSACVFKRG